MAILATDWTVSRANGNIRYVGDDHGGILPSYATVIDLHRWLQDLADDASAFGDDELDITDANPSDRSTDSIVTLLGLYNIDNVAAEHLYDGSIIQTSGDEIYDGFSVIGNADQQIQIIQNGAVLADDYWNFGGAGLNADANQGLSHRFMLKVRIAGADIDGRRILGTCRRFGFTYKEFPVNGSVRGNNVIALGDSIDLNNQTLSASVATWTTVTNVEGYQLLDVNNDSINEPYYSQWTRDSYSINQFYERLKWLTRDGGASTLYGLPGELFRGVTHDITVDTPIGTFVNVEPVSWATGTGQLLAIDSTTAASRIFIQILTGVPPIDNQVITGGTSSASVAVNISVSSRSVSTPFVGVSTGSSLIGAYGVGLQLADLSVNDKITDLTGTLRTPPNTIVFTVGGLVSAEDRILVAPWDGATLDTEGNPTIDLSQMSLSGGLISATQTSITTSAAIPNDTPSSGTLRVQLDSGKYLKVDYVSWAASTFAIPSTDFSVDTASTVNNLWVSYIDKLATSTIESFSAIYNTDRNLVVVCRDGGLTPTKQFVSSALLGANGGSITVIRTSDS